MADEKLAELWLTQKSLTEWLQDIKHADVAAIRREDNDKRERLKVLNRVIGLPFDEPVQFKASELRDDNPKFTDFLREHGQELCALRLMPFDETLPKLRMRGKTISGAYEWFKGLNIRPADYRADFVPHANQQNWATIFIVNKHGIQGEIIAGGHSQLTQGFHDNAGPSIFRFDFKNWSMTPKNDLALAHLKEVVRLIHVPDTKKQKQLSEKLGSTFHNNYLSGYFETSDTERGIWFIDYGQALGKMYQDVVFRIDSGDNIAKISGQTGCGGMATGVVCIVEPDNLDDKMPENAVLVCMVTTPNYVPLMQKCVAIVTDQGGVLSHAAIVARELGKPCIVGTGNATKSLKNGVIVIVDADKGTVNLA